MKQVISTWWPLAASWILMGLELPGISAVLARLPDPEIHLAAYGSVVFSLALIIEAPIIMALAASTALAGDRESFFELRRFVLVLAGVLTLIHALIAFTPLFDLVVADWIHPPSEILPHARIGLQIMVPWTAAIAYRRFNQGVLIRFGHSRAVGIGTALRLITVSSALFLGYRYGELPGVVVGTSAVIAGVLIEALYSRLRLRPVLREQIQSRKPESPALTLPAILDFYVPLAMTSLLFLLAQPLISAALSRMPDALSSLAVWPVLSGLVFILRAPGVAYNEVVVALLDKPETAARSLRRFTWALALGSLGLIALLIATPLSRLWFETLSGLKPELAQMAEQGLRLAIALPPLSAALNWFQGVIVHSRRTRAITESVVIYLGFSALTLWAGVLLDRWTGLIVAMVSFSISVLAQTIWLALRSRRAREELVWHPEDQEPVPVA